MADAIHGSLEPKKADKFPDWVLLDRFGRTHCYDDPNAAAAAVENDATSVAVTTTTDESGYFSFTLRTPPSVSYLDLHWPYGIPKSVLDIPAIPVILSADENFVLLRIHLQNQSYFYSAPDIFVYTASASSPPSLRRLPECTKEARGLAGRDKFLRVDANIGFLCRGGDQGDYVVADLLVSWKASGTPVDVGHDCMKPSPVIAVLCAFSSRKGEWAVNEMLAPQPQDQGEFPILWYSDRVLPFAGRFLCWIDYYSGVLLCDFSNDNSPTLCYKPFPGKQYTDEDRSERGCPEEFRSVSVSQGIMYFVHIGDNGQETGGSCQKSGLTITIWTLKIADNNISWEMHRVISLSDLWVQHGYQAQGLPRRPPEFPVVTKNDRDVLCCVLREHESIGKVWIIMLDMKNAAFRLCVRYINEQIICCNEAFDTGDESIFCNVPLLPSDFSKYLNKPPELPRDSDMLAIHPSSKRSKLALYDM